MPDVHCPDFRFKRDRRSSHKVINNWQYLIDHILRFQVTVSEMSPHIGGKPIVHA